MDVSVYVDGFHGDNCGSLVVGHSHSSSHPPSSSSSVSSSSVSSECMAGAVKLVDTTRGALESAIAKLGPGVCLSLIGTHSSQQQLAISNSIYRLMNRFSVYLSINQSINLSVFILYHCHSHSVSLSLAGETIESIATANNFQVVQEFVGHGK